MVGLKQAVWSGKPAMVMVEGALPLPTPAPPALIGSELHKCNLSCGRIVNLAGGWCKI